MGTGEGGGCSALGRLVVPHWPAVVEGAFSGDAEWDFGVGRGPREVGCAAFLQSCVGRRGLRSGPGAARE